MKWWIAGLASFLFSAAGCTAVPENSLLEPRDWHEYKARFVVGGAVRDTGNQHASHSEGQGYAMLLAEAYDDRETFDELWNWTQDHLQIRYDYLFAWRWRPAKGADDLNNATDGDLLIAWALLRASERWKHMDYRLDARKILLDASRLLVVDLNGQKVLLPGEQGFQKERGLELNLAYWVFPALETFAQIDPKGPWQKLIRSGLYLAETLALGPYRLPPDWVLWRTEEDPDVAPGRPARFGYEVIRAPLYLAWSEQRQSTLATRFLAYWNGYDTGKVPAWISLVTDDKANYPAPAGFDAVYQLVSFDAQKQSGKDSELAPPSLTLNTPVANQDYYSASLSLLAKLAMNERFNP